MPNFTFKNLYIYWKLGFSRENPIFVEHFVHTNVEENSNLNNCYCCVSVYDRYNSRFSGNNKNHSFICLNSFINSFLRAFGVPHINSMNIIIVSDTHFQRKRAPFEVSIQHSNPLVLTPPNSRQ